MFKLKKDSIDVVENKKSVDRDHDGLFLEQDELLQDDTSAGIIKVDKQIFDDFIKGASIDIVFVDSKTPNTSYTYIMQSEDEDGIVMQYLEDSAYDYDVVESVEGDQYAKDYIASKDANFEKDKEAERQAKIELAKNGIDAIHEEYEDIAANVEQDLQKVVNMLRQDLVGEINTIKVYDEHAKFCREKGFEEIASALESIAEEEKVHIGELQFLLNEHDEGLEQAVKQGESEAEELVNTVNNDNPEQPEIDQIQVENKGLDPQDILEEEEDELFEVDKLLTSRYGEGSITFADENNIPHVALLNYLEAHYLGDPLEELQAEINAGEFNLDEFTRLYV